MTKTLTSFAIAALLLTSCIEAGYKTTDSAETPSKAAKVDSFHVEWSKNATIYEVNVRQHSPEGTFTAVTDDLRRLRNLGVKILWLMPIHPIGEKNRKGSKGSYYSVRDYKAVNPEFGTLEDFKELVDEAHRDDMKVIIDWVANHSAHDNVWVEEHKDRYILDENGETVPPEGTDWYDVADLDYDNPDTRAAMIDAMMYWVEETGIDGFRCDVASFVPTDFWEAARDSLERIKPDIFMLAESEDPRLLQKAFDMDYAWEFLHIINGIAKGEKDLAAIDAYMAKEDTNYAPDDYRMYFITNHDENSWNGTVFERFGPEAHKAFAVLTFTIDGMPLVYGGQEAAMDYALEFFEKDTIRWNEYPLQDFYADLLWLNRDNPALWNGEYGGDFRRMTTTADDRVYAFRRTNGPSQVITIVNLSPDTLRFSIEDMPNETMVSLFDDVEIATLRDSVSMLPWGYHVFSQL